MRKILLISTICLVCLSGTLAKGKKELTILHTNDTHSCILPLSTNLADTMLAGRGGFLRRIAMLKEERAKCPDLLYFDSGDFSQGSPYYNMLPITTMLIEYSAHVLTMLHCPSSSDLYTSFVPYASIILHVLSSPLVFSHLPYIG